MKLRVAHALGMPGTFSPPPTPKEASCKRPRHASRHVRHARAVMHVRIANPQWLGKRSRYFWRMHNPQFYVSGKRPMNFLSPNVMNNETFYYDMHNCDVTCQAIHGSADHRPQRLVSIETHGSNRSL